MNITTSDFFGQPVILTHQKIYQSLTHPQDGFAHVFAHDPKMVIINRIKHRGVWAITIDELYDDEIDDTPLKSIYHLTYADSEIDVAIEMFLSLIKSQRKDFESNIYKKLGKFVILSNIPRKLPAKKSDIQKYLYEAFRENVKRSIDRRRSRSSARKGKKGRQNG
jgi:hypothetical protein